MDEPFELRFEKPTGVFVCRASGLIVRDKKFLAVAHVDLPGYFYTVGGAVNLHETSDAAVVREVYEEVGVWLEIERLAFVNEEFFLLDGKKFHQVTFYYLMKAEPYLDIAEGDPTDQEGETLHWLPVDSLGNYNLVPRFLRSWSLDNAAVEHIISEEY